MDGWLLFGEFGLQGLPAVLHFGILVFWLFVFCLSFCYLKLWSNHVAISNTEFTSWFGLRLPLVMCWIL
jgi:hypothetical protein